MSTVGNKMWLRIDSWLYCRAGNRFQKQLNDRLWDRLWNRLDVRLFDRILNQVWFYIEDTFTGGLRVRGG